LEFQFTEEQEQFREFVRRFFVDTTPTTEVRRIMETEAGFDAGVWRRLSEELSLTGLCIPEAYGGSGFGVTELGIAMEEMGRTLYPSPFFASAILAAKTIEYCASEDEKIRLLPAIASGEKIATLALMESSGSVDLGDVQMQAAGSGKSRSGQFQLNGEKKFVLDGCIADLILVVARTRSGLSVFLVESAAPGIKKSLLNVIDPTRKIATIEFTNTPATLLGVEGAAETGLQKMLDVAYIALANESVGGASRLFEDTLAYTKLRRQFGRTIASFQAIKHRMTEFLLAVELAKSAAYYAAAAHDEAAPDISMLASLAKAGASETYLQAAIDSIQLHGGIGFTWENDTHLWFKRAKSSEVFLGDPAWHRSRMIAEMVKEQAA